MKTKMEFKEIIISSYYLEEEDGTIRINEDAMRDEFKEKLAEILRETEEYNKNK
jgi:hypothetical protein